MLTIYIYIYIILYQIEVNMLNLNTITEEGNTTTAEPQAVGKCTTVMEVLFPEHQ